MKTIYAGLPIYNTPIKQEVTRSGAKIPFFCSRTSLIPFLIEVTGDTPGAMTTVELINAAGTSTNITSYFVSLPATFTAGSKVYFQYKGTTLKFLLPLGAYYLKMTTANGFIYYSEWFNIDNIYDDLLVSWTNNSFDTFTVSGTQVTSAIKATGFASAQGTITSFRKGEVLTFFAFLTLNSGDAPDVRIRIPSTSNISNVETLVPGLNVITLTITQDSNNAGAFLETSGATNFSLSGVRLVRMYSPIFTKLTFKNTKDLGDILYQDGWIQTHYFEAILNNPEHGLVEFGSEKDGIFITEKLVTTLDYKLICYVNRAQYMCLARLPQHDTVTITDEVGNVYTPAVGNVRIESAEWVTYETIKLTIGFNNGSNSAFSWTSGMTNLS